MDQHALRVSEPAAGREATGGILRPLPGPVFPFPVSMLCYLSAVMSRFACIAAILILAVCAPAYADDLYVGEAVLEEQEGVSDRALLRALDEVLIRLTGRTEPSPVESLGLGVGQLDALLQSQQLVRRDRLDEAGETVSELRVQAEFDQPAVNRLLRENDMPRWGRERPAILLWMVLEDEEGVRFAEDPYLEDLVGEQARRLGLDIVRPLGDALDMAEVALADVRGGFLDSAQSAARRYGAGVIAMLDLRQERGVEEGYWSGRWFWRVRERDAGFNRSADVVAEIIESGLRRLAASMATRYAVRSHAGESGRARVNVDGIVDAFQFSEVTRYLEGLSVVDEMRIVAARERSMEFELELAGEGLEDFLEMSDLLVFERQTADGHLHYRLRR